YVTWHPAKIAASGENVVGAYLRLVVRDRPGILARVSGVLARHNINIDSVLQEPAHSKRRLPFVMTLEPTREKAVSRAVSEIAQRVTYKTRTLISGGRRSERNQEVQRRTVDLNGRGRRLLGQHLVRLRPRAVNLDNVAYRQPTLDGRDLRGARARADHVRNLN